MEPHLPRRSRPRGGLRCSCSHSSCRGKYTAASGPSCHPIAGPRCWAGHASLSPGPEGCAACGRPPTHSCPEKASVRPSCHLLREPLSAGWAPLSWAPGHHGNQEPPRGLYSLGDTNSDLSRQLGESVYVMKTAAQGCDVRQHGESSGGWGDGYSEQGTTTHSPAGGAGHRAGGWCIWETHRELAVRDEVRGCSVRHTIPDLSCEEQELQLRLCGTSCCHWGTGSGGLREGSRRQRGSKGERMGLGSGA